MDKELYKQKLHKLVESLKLNPDSELLEYLLAELSSTPMYREKIDRIYELCVAEILKQQAHDFYKNFPIKEIVEELENDFRRMELFHQSANFGDFCLALYQQIENITNKVCTNQQFTDIVEKMWSCSAYIQSGAGSHLEISNRIGEFNIAKLVLIDSTKESYADKSKRALQGQYAMDKIRIVIYYFGYYAMMKSGDYDYYKEITNTMSDIYTCRNLNHRGSNSTERETQIYDRILSQQSYYYFKFLGALAQYVNYIVTGYPKLNMIYEYSQTVIPKPILSGPKIVGRIDLQKK